MPDQTFDVLLYDFKSGPILNLRPQGRLLRSAYGTFPIAFPEPIKHFGEGLSLHKEMYLMPATWTEEYQGKETEVVFQLSAKQRAFKTNLYFGYTQQSFWGAYNTDASAPFRESNYNPEVFYRFKPGSFSSWGLGNSSFVKGLGADIGFEHESNGQSLPLSRSWNRLYFIPGYTNDNLLVQLKLSYRLPEDNKENPDATKGDDNPDITDYYGHAELNVYQQFYKSYMVHLMLRGNGRTKKGAIAMTYSLPGLSGIRFI